MSRKIKKVILVEDDDSHAEIFEFYAMRFNQDVCILRMQDGAEMIEFLEQELKTGGSIADLIFLDLNLPKFSGLEVLEKLKAQPITRKIPTVVFTSSDSSKDVSKSFEMGANSYLRKPTDANQYKPLIFKALEYWSLNEGHPSGQSCA